MRNIVFCLIFTAIFSGCAKDEKAELRKERATQFITEYLKKYPEDATIVVRYEDCVKGRDEAVDKCLFMTTKHDMQKYIVNKYIAEREVFLKNGKLDEPSDTVQNNL